MIAEQRSLALEEAMGQVTQFFQPPLYWQQFEDLTESLVGEVFRTTRITKNGRPGQAQRGVDVWAHTADGLVGVQCKRLDDLDENNHPYPGGVITRKLLLAEVSQAETFRPKLDHFILATTAKRDGKIQQFARALHEQRTGQGKFGVRLWFWDDYVTWLNNIERLQKWYYSTVIQIRSERDQDRLILDLIGMAFDRPAFEDRLNHERLDDFVQALADTQAALRTGELVNRESRHVIRKVIGGWRDISEPAWKDCMKLLSAELTALRAHLVDGIKDGRITQRHGYLEIDDLQLLVELDQRRRGCVELVHWALADAGLPTP